VHEEKFFELTRSLRSSESSTTKERPNVLWGSAYAVADFTSVKPIGIGG
jgi:hypothetical protein